MNPLPTSAVTFVGGEAIIDAEVLAPALGLSPGALRDEMREGLVYSIAEAGVDEDAGRTRLTFRYRARCWRVVVLPDGTLLRDPTPNRVTPPAPNDPLSLLGTPKDASWWQQCVRLDKLERPIDALFTRTARTRAFESGPVHRDRYRRARVAMRHGE